MTSGILIALTEQPSPVAKPDTRRAYLCPGCGYVLRVFGVGRHRVYFELDDERLDDPVMHRVCSDCGHALPGKNPR